MRSRFVYFSQKFLRLTIWACSALLVGLSSVALGQDLAPVAPAAPRPLITSAVDEAQLTPLKGNTHPLARAEFDLGTAPASLPMERMLLVLKRSPEQEAALGRLMDEQQDKNSPNYHKWMTPEQFGQQFGPADPDLQAISGWLQAHGFRVGSTKGRTVLEFSGSASQVQETFHTTIHKYMVNGEQRWANASDPQIPSALVRAVAGVASLNNFPRKPMNAPAGAFVRDKATGKIQPIDPLFSFPAYQCSAVDYCFAVGPYDFATIYNLLPLWNSGVNGAGQTIAIVGESNINIQDVADFRSMFNLPVNNPTVILNGPDPGIQGDESEADIDVQWSGAAAPNATIDFVVSESTETTAGIDLSAVYIVENNLAPVMSESYGLCELALGTAGNQFYNALWQQAAAQGITVFVSSGDNGAAGCDDFNVNSPAKYGLEVSGFASTPYNVAVGGTEFNDFTNPTQYWTTTNDPTTQASALSYIPESTWNDSCTNAIWSTVGLSTNAETNCNDSRLNDLQPQGGSGGASKCTTPSGSTASSCSGGYAKPSWQSGKGVPADGKRDVPDVSLFASNGFLGHFYIICQTDQTGSCNLNNGDSYFLGFGGTSVSSPAFAGIMALVNQQTGQRQGNANYIFYKLATQQPTAFHDVTTGTVAMPCKTGTANCTTNVSGHAYGILSGYNTTAGYDQATGLGSVDANALVTKWNTVTLLPSKTMLSSLTPTTITHGQAVNFSASVASASGTGATPTGLLSLEGGPSNSSGGIAGFNLSNGTVSGSTDLLPGGTYSVTAHYPGDSTYGASDSSPISVTVSKESSQPQLFLVTFDGNGRVISSNTNTAEYASPYLLRVNVENSAGKLCNPITSSGATGCPSGNVTLTDNGNPLDGATFALNSFGYVEDQPIQLKGGAHSVKATYAGDDSFTSSSATNAITITPAFTTMNNPYISGIPAVGQSASISVVVNTTTSAAAPSGTVTFYANGTALNGTITYIKIDGQPGSNAYEQALITTDTNAFPVAGTYAITAAYNGDANYSPSTSSADSISVLYPTPLVAVTPYQQTLSYGSTATLTALVDTTNKTAYPTGTVTFVDSNTGATLSGPTSCANATDASGYYACKVVGTFTVTSGDEIISRYSGDSNYPANTNYAFIYMPDFTMSPQSGVSLTAGQSQNLTISFSSSSGLSGTVNNFSCSGLPAETTCTFNPTQVTLPSNGSATTTLTISTTAIGQAHRRAANDQNRMMWGITQGMVLLGACFIGIPFSRRRRRIPLALALISLLILLPSCGGGSGGGGGGGTPNPVPSISSLNPTQIAAGSQIQSLYVNGSNFMSTSTVTYNGTVHNSSLQSSTQIQIALVANDVATTGQYPVVVTNPAPGGGSSAPVNFAILTGTPTGNFSVMLNASSGAITHTVPLSISVQ